jgi:hypothetical protein
MNPICSARWPRTRWSTGSPDSGWARDAIVNARARTRATAWVAGAAPKSVTFDIDVTLLNAHSEKEEAAPNYEGGFGHHPLCCFLDETHDALAGFWVGVTPGLITPMTP